MDDPHEPPADPPNSAAAAASAADAMALFEEAEAEAAAAEALASAAQARARAARLRREAKAMADSVENYGDAALAAADAEAFEEAADEGEYEEEEYEYEDEDEYDEDYDDEAADEDTDNAEAAEPKPRPAWLRWVPPLPIVAKVAAVLITCAFVGVTVYMVLQHDHAAKIAEREDAFAAGAKRCVINMTSLDYNKAREDVQRVIDSSTGEFKNDFQSRADDFTTVVTQSKSITEGTVNAAAVESVNGDSAVVLVSATSRIINSPAGKNEPPRIWRLRVTVTHVDGQYKMSKVEYVP